MILHPCEQRRTAVTDSREERFPRSIIRFSRNLITHSSSLLTLLLINILVVIVCVRLFIIRIAIYVCYCMYVCVLYINACA